MICGICRDRWVIDQYRWPKNFQFEGLWNGLGYSVPDDDILELTANGKELGKPIYSDIREGKKTVLLIKAIHSASEKQKEKNNLK